MGKHDKPKKESRGGKHKKGGLGFKPGKEKCWTCDGTGSVDDKVCPDCDGTGEH